MKGLVVIAIAIAVAGCAREDEDPLPGFCGDREALVRALAAAPDPVRVEGTRISDCFTKDSSVGDVQVAGSALLQTAERLGSEGDAVGLGYLVGALRARSVDTQGIHAEVVRRIEQEARPFFRSRGFERGLRAGRSSG